MPGVLCLCLCVRALVTTPPTWTNPFICLFVCVPEYIKRMCAVRVLFPLHERARHGDAANEKLRCVCAVRVAKSVTRAPGLRVYMIHLCCDTLRSSLRKRVRSVCHLSPHTVRTFGVRLCAFGFAGARMTKRATHNLMRKLQITGAQHSSQRAGGPP